MRHGWMSICVALLSFMTLINTAALSQEAVCQAETAAIAAVGQQITQKYKAQLDQISTEASRKAKRIEDDNPPPSGAGAVLKFDIKVTSHDEEFIFGVPSVTMKQQTLAMDLPTTTMRRQEWSWDVPETRMVRRCTPGIPETVCDEGALPTCDLRGCRGGRAPSCSLRAGREICTDIPEIRMVTRRASMDVPEFVMRRQEIKLDLPEFKLVQTRIVITIPDFTLVNVEAQQQKTQDDSKALVAQTRVEAANISSKMKTEVKSASADKIANVFSCNENNILSQRDKVVSDIDSKIQAAQSQATEARTQKNEALANSLDASVKLLIAARDQVVGEFAKGIAQLRLSRDEALQANARDN